MTGWGTVTTWICRLEALTESGTPARRRANRVLSLRLLFGTAVVFSVLTLLASSPAWARTGTPRVSVSFVAVGGEVNAGGTVGAGTPPGAGKRSRWEVDLQQRAGTRWLTRITGRLHSHGRLSGF